MAMGQEYQEKNQHMQSNSFVAMAAPPTDDPFIVILGHNPLKGKRERISKVRAHVTKRHFHKLHHKTEAEQRPAARPSSASQNCSPPDIGNPLIANELRNSVPVTSHALLDPAFFTVETTRRMHRFFDIHLRGHVNSHPFLSNIVRWAISDPQFTSSKLLNASGWDDILESGELSLWTIRQRSITIRLLNDTFTLEPRTKNLHVTVAAIQSLLGFELLIGNNQNIIRLNDFYQSLISQPIQPNDDDVWTSITRCHSLLSYADRLRRTGDDNIHDNHASSSSNFPEQDYQFAFPADFSLFTFSQPSLTEDHQYIYDLLYSLYQIISIAASYQTLPLSNSTHKYVVSLHEQLIPYITDQDPTNIDTSIPTLNSTPSDINDQRIAPLLLSTFILTSCLLSNRNNSEAEENQTQNLTELASRLRTLLSSPTSGFSTHTNWQPFQGALMWCHAIGLRFADPRRDRTWFLMQFLRVTHLCVLETWEATSRSMEVIVCGLENIGRVNVEPVE